MLITTSSIIRAVRRPLYQDEPAFTAAGFALSDVVSAYTAHDAALWYPTAINGLAIFKRLCFDRVFYITEGVADYSLWLMTVSEVNYQEWLWESDSGKCRKCVASPS